MPVTISKKDLLAKLHQLPSLPVIVQEVIASFNNADLDTTSLVYKISQDQGLSAKVLRVANSPFYGLSRQVGSIQEAITVLGFNCVRSLVLSAGMIHTLSSTTGSSFDRQVYWQRSFRVATIAKALVKEFRQEQQLAFIAGMFYDIGQLVLDLCIPQQFAGLLRQQATSGLDLIELERAELGFDHAEIGAEVIRLWNFPAEIEQVVRDWHQPEREPFSSLVSMVHVAVLLESGLSVEYLMTHLPETLRTRMRVEWESVERSLPRPDELEAAASLAMAS